MNEDVVEDDELYDRVSFLIPLMKVVVKLSFGITFISANLVNQAVPACIKILSKEFHFIFVLCVLFIGICNSYVVFLFLLTGIYL